MEPTCFLRVVGGSGTGGVLEQLWSDGVWRLLQKVNRQGDEIYPVMTQDERTELREQTGTKLWGGRKWPSEIGSE